MDEVGVGHVPIHKLLLEGHMNQPLEIKRVYRLVLHFWWKPNSSRRGKSLLKD
jgi:hypothetical protein